MRVINPRYWVCLLALGFASCTNMERDPANIEQLEQEVAATEQAFADTMAARDFDGFLSYLADDTVFFAGDQPLRGKQAVADAWQPFYESEAAPFSWEPKTVVVRATGEMAHSSGPVFAPDGAQVGIFNSVWQRERNGSWKIVFDKGGCVCPKGR